MVGYFSEDYNICVHCQRKNILGGYCDVCTPNNSTENCECYSGYVLENTSCIKCSDNCDQYKYDKENNKTKCLKCIENFTLNKANECVPCLEGCSLCYLDNDNIPICLICKSNLFKVDEKNNSLIPPLGCSEYEYDRNNEEFVCIRCDTGYVFNQKNNQCLNCQGLNDTGIGCKNCYFNPLREKYECINCHYYYHVYYDGYERYQYNYAYVKNTYQCLSNTNKKIIGLYGCLTAIYNNISGQYECLECKNYTYDYFFPVINNNSCIDPYSDSLFNYCIEAEKIGERYSCTKCNSNYALIEDMNSKLKGCYERENNLSYCSEGKLLENGNLICTKCSNNSVLKENICSCDLDSFSKDKINCYKCNDYNKGNPGCKESERCEYFSANDQLNCNQCKGGYFNYTEGQCLLCSGIIPNVLNVIMITQLQN